MPHNGGIRILAHGSFGNAVAEHLTAASGPGECAVQVAGTSAGHGLCHFLSGGELGIMASSRDAPADLDAFAAAAAATGVTWLPVALGRRQARVGPVVVPGAAPCPACYSVRLAQHGQAARTVGEDVEHAFDQDEAPGVEGYPPHIAAIAAGLALMLARSPAGQARPIWPARCS